MANLRFLQGTDIKKLPTYSSSTVGQIYFLTDTTNTDTTKWNGKIIYDSPDGRLVMSTNSLSAIYAGDDTTPIKDKYLTRLAWEGTSTKVEGYNGNNRMITSITLGDRVLPLAGGTMTGAINFANNVLNNVGDDASFGDHNKAGSIGIKGKNGATTLTFLPYSGNTSQSISTDGNGTMTVTGTLAGTFKGKLTGTASTAITVGQGNNPGTDKDANDLILNEQSKLTFYSFNTSKLANRPSGSGWGYLTVGSYSGSYNYQTFIDGDNGTTWNRIFYNGTWHAWKKVLDSSNYTSYTVTKTGSGASGTWGINISGSSASCTGNAVTATKLQTARKINNTTFDGSTDITTDKWGKSRTISISATAGTTGIEVDGSANATLVVPSTMSGFAKITSTTFVGSLSGNASSATEFSAAKSVTLTGDVTGSASSKAGWSVATTIANNAVTTAKIKNANVTNAKLQYSSMTIAGNSVSLGASLTADTLRTSLGLSTALHFIGIATVAITDGSTTDPGISGYTTKTAGDVIIDKDKFFEYIWTGSAWERLGGDTSYKVTQSAIASPPTGGSTIAFIDTISQDANGIITATKKNVREASTSQSGVVSTGAQSFAGNKTFTGQVYITNASDASSTTGNTGALIVGNSAGEHLAIDGNEIIAKSNGTTNGTLYLNDEGGTIQVGALIQPKTNNAIDLGTSSLKYRTVYATTFSGNASTASKVNNNLVLKVNTGTTEGTNLYTYNGSAAKTIDFKSGTNVTVTAAAGTVTFSSPSLSGGSAAAANATVVGGVTVSGHAVTVAKKTLTPGTAITVTGAADKVTIAHSNVVTAGTVSDGGSARTLAFGETFKIPSITYNAQGHITGTTTTTITMPANPNTDTKNTAGSTNSTAKLFLIGATSQAANPQTYSNSKVYATDGAFNATTVRVAEAVTLQYDATAKCLNFVFA